MINLTKWVPSRFHHIRLNKEFFKDLKTWKAFLADWNGRSFFLNTTVTPSPQMELYTDALGTIGYGGYFNGKWFQGRWLPHMQLSRVTGISIGERDFTMFWAAFTLAFFAFLRSSEFTCRGTTSYSPSFDLSVSSASFEPNLACPQRMSVFLQSSKTDAFRRGHTLVIACSSLFLTCASPGSLFFFISFRLPTNKKIGCFPSQARGLSGRFTLYTLFFIRINFIRISRLKFAKF